MDLSKTPLLYPQNWDFILGHFQSMLSEYGLYNKDHDGIPGTFSAVGTALRSFYKNCFIALPRDLHVEFMSKLIASIEEQHFAAAPLVCVFYSLSSVPSMPLLGPDSLQRIRNILLHLGTHAINLRLASKGFILTTVSNLTDPSLVSWDVIFNLLAVGRLDECLQRNSWLWERLCSWIWNTEDSRQELREKSSEKEIQSEKLNQFLTVKVDNFLKDQESHQDLINDEAASLGRIIIAVADTFHSYKDEYCETIATILNKIFQNFHDASTRLYMSEARLCKAVTLLASMLQVLCDDSAGSHDNTVDESRDRTKELVTKSLIHSLNDILNLLTRKLASLHNEVDSYQTFSYFKLCQALLNFYTDNSSLKSSWAQFCSFLESTTRSNINIIQDLQGYSNHDSKQWASMHQSMTLLAWMCDVTRDNHVTISESIPKILLDAIPTFKLSVESKKPGTVSSSDVSYQDALDSTSAWRDSVSGYLGALWKTAAYFIEHFTTETACRKQDIETVSSNEQAKLTVNSSSKQVLEAAIEALDVASSDNVLPIIISIGLLIPKILHQHEQLCSHAIDMVWGTLKVMWDKPSFWEVYQTTMTVLMSPSLLMLSEEHPLTLKVKACVDDVVIEGESRPGIMNIVVEQLSDVWTREPSLYSSSVKVYKDLVVELLLYNASIQKSHVVDVHVDAFLRHDMVAQSPLCALGKLERRDDAQVRVIITNILLTFDASNPSVHEVLLEIVQILLKKDKEITVANAKMYMNSRSHRRKHRAWQAVLVFLPLILVRDTQGACAEEVLRYTFRSLEDSNQISVQNFQQWIILYLLNR